MLGRYGLYAKYAFLNHWHLLALGGATLFSLLAPMKDVTFPLLVASELMYHAVLCTNPRFQRQVNSVVGAADSQKQQEEAANRFRTLYGALDRDSQQAFNELQRRCESITDAAPPENDSMDKISSTHADGINKLLWMFLKLLYTRCMIDKFLKTSDDDSFSKLEARTKKRITELKDDPANDAIAKMRRSLEDTMATIEARRNNLKRAQNNREFIGMELDRIGAKLTTLAEMAVNRQDPSFITSEVDEVSRSVELTEQAITELSTFAGISIDSEAAPELIATRRQPDRVRI